MKTQFHRDILPLTPWEYSGLQATAQILRDRLTPGCDCAGIASWGHTTACRMQSEYRDSIEQTICESSELRLTWEEVYSAHFAPVKTGLDLQANVLRLFAPHNPGYRTICKL